MCQRYCYRIDATSNQIASNFGAVSSSAGYATLYLPVTSRVPPTGIVASSNWIMNNYGSGSISATTPTFVTATANSLTVQCTGGSGMSGGTIGQFYPNASAYIYTSGSEL